MPNPVETPVLVKGSADEFFSRPLRFFIGLVGEPGAGKTRASLSFPKIYFIEVGDTYGLKTVASDPKNAKLRPNLVKHVSIDMEDRKEAKEIFKVGGEGSIYGVLDDAKKMAAKGEIETVVLEGLSFLFDYKGTEIGKGAGVSDGDRWAYYRQLKNDLTWFVNANLMPLVSRHNVNLIISLHVQREGEESKAKQTTQTADWQPRIEGGFRQSMSALPRAMIYLHQKVEMKGAEQVMKYFAYCQPVKVPHVGMIPAKNSYGLQPVIDLTDKHLYNVLVESTKGAAVK
jgi:AAA domain